MFPEFRFWFLVSWNSLHGFTVTEWTVACFKNRCGIQAFKWSGSCLSNYFIENCLQSYHMVFSTFVFGLMNFNGKYYAKFIKQCLRINSELQILLLQSKSNIFLKLCSWFYAGCRIIFHTKGKYIMVLKVMIASVSRQQWPKFLKLRRTFKTWIK